MIKLIKPQVNKMKRVTISMPDSIHEKITKYSEDHSVSFSKACSHLSAIGFTSRTSDDLSRIIVGHLSLNNVNFFMTGNFTVPESVIQRAISYSISTSDKSDQNSPLTEFAEIVGA